MNDPNSAYFQFTLLKGAGLLRSSGASARMARFDATEAGRKVFTPQPMDPNRPRACWANVRVDTIVKWFDHPQKNSMAVNWTYKLTDVADWAKRPEVARGILDIHAFQDEAGKKVYGAVLKLSNKGWDCIQS